MEEHRRNFFLISAVICMFTILGIVFMSSFATPAQAAFFQTPEPEIVQNYSAESNEFYCRTINESGERYLKYDAFGKKLVITDNPSEAIFNITFVTDSTVNVAYGETNIGYSSGDTELKTTKSTWTLENGILKNSTGDRKLLFQISNSTGRCYAHKIGPSYDPVYFYSTLQYNEAQTRCVWTADRQSRLTNLAYDVGIKHTISFNANGGTGSMPDNYVSDGVDYAVPETSGFISPQYKAFDGWALTPDGDKIVDTIKVTEDITLYALWKDVDFIVAYILPENYASKTGTAFDIVYDFLTIHVTQGSIYPKSDIRIFKNQTITITSSDNHKLLRRVEFVCTASGSAEHGPGSFGTLDGYSYAGYSGVWDGERASVSFTASNSQVRAKQIIISCNN